jgi:hypothetical protein
MARGDYLARTAGGTQAPPTGQSGGPGGMTFSEASSNPNIMSQQEAQQAQQAFDTATPNIDIINQQFQDKVQKEKEEAERLKLLEELDAGIPKTGIFGLDQSNLSLGSFPSFLNMGAAALKGLDSTNRFFKNLAEKGPGGLDPEDKVILANLIAAGGLEGGIDFNKYTTEDFNLEQLKKSFETAAGDLKEGVTIDGKTVSYEDLIDQYEEGKPEGVGNLFGLLKDKERTEGITLEKLKDTLGSEGLAYLQANDPALYFNTFGVPATLAGTEMDKLAGMSLQGLTNSPEDKKLAQMIVEARERLADDRNRNQPQGIPSLPGYKFPDAEAGLPTPPNVYPLPPGIIPPFGFPEGDKFDRPAPSAPYNYYAQSPQYRSRGIPSVNTNEFNKQLRKLYGMA